MKNLFSLFLLIIFPVSLSAQAPSLEDKILHYDEKDYLINKQVNSLNRQPIKTDFGTISLHVTKDSTGKNYAEIWLFKPNGKGEKLWYSENFSPNNRFSNVNNPILTAKTFSFLIDAHTIYWVKCHKSINGTWRETDRKTVYDRGYPDFRTTEPLYLMPNERTVIIQKFRNFPQPDSLLSTKYYTWKKDKFYLDEYLSLSPTLNNWLTREIKTKQWKSYYGQ